MARPTDDQLCWGWNPLRPGEQHETVVEAPHRDRPDQTQTWSCLSPVGPEPAQNEAHDTDSRFSFSLRQAEVAGPTLDATLGAFGPQTRTQDQVAPDRGNASGADLRETPFPESGDGIAGFRLISELGRGAFGRVFLAEESLLGNRLVALKISRAEGDEPRLLARLQHTHIVPIHSVHDDPRTGLRVMCMPYFGGANLAQVLDAVGSSRGSGSGTRSLLHALDVIGQPRPSEAFGPLSPRRRTGGTSLTGGTSTPARRPAGANPSSSAGRNADGPIGPGSNEVSQPSTESNSVSSHRWSLLHRVSGWPGSLRAAQRAWSRPRPDVEPSGETTPIQPARRFLREASYVRAAAWIVARLAEGLEHAHLHGLLHRDLKPSNILIAADGTPMLLDFNLAADATLKARESDRVRLGGTLPYMAPEHLDAFHPRGTTPPEGVDERSDIYALGLILFEIIAGRRPFAEPEPNRPILDTIQAMIEERKAGAPSLRSLSSGVPADLDAVVRKCLHPDPDRRHARAGDLAEDLRRFLDDQPLRFAVEPTWQGRITKWLRRNPRATGASTMGLLGLAMIVFVSGAGLTIAQHLRITSARLKLKGFESRFPECQFLLNTVGGPVRSLGRGIALAEETLDQAGITLAARASEASGGWLDALPLEEQREIRRDLAEVVLLLARARVFLAERTSSHQEMQRSLHGAIAWLDRAEQIDTHPTLSLYEDRATYRAKLNDAVGAARDRRKAEAIAPSTGRDYYLQGTSLLAKGESDAAEEVLIKATILTPQGFWPYFALGLCHFDQKRYAEAAGDFTVCSVLAPRFAWPWVNRGLALAHANRLVEARLAYDRAVAIDESLADAWASRGLLALELDDLSAARADLERAIDLGRDDVDTKAALGEALGRSNQRDDALQLLDELIRKHPTAVLARLARGTLRVQHDLPGGEDDFRAILQQDSRQSAALVGLARARRHTHPAEALELAAKAHEIDPEQIDAIELCALLRGKLGDPRVFDDVDRLKRVPNRTRLYNAACSLARYYRHQARPETAQEAIRLLERACQLGIPIETVAAEPDFLALASEPNFKAILSGPAAPPPSPKDFRGR